MGECQSAAEAGHKRCCRGETPQNPFPAAGEGSGRPAWPLHSPLPPPINPTPQPPCRYFGDPSLPVIYGECGSYKPRNMDGLESVVFAMGGGGILLSHAAMELLAPHFETCREKYNKLYYSDARVAACLQVEAGVPDVVQCRERPRAWKDAFSAKPIEDIAKERSGRVISIHEKNNTRAAIINSFVNRPGWGYKHESPHVEWKDIRTEVLTKF